jgi:transposase InsO family protein
VQELWDWRAGYSVAELNEIATEWNHTYNHVRPHQALGYKTPAEYLKSWNQMSKDKGGVSTM